MTKPANDWIGWLARTLTNTNSFREYLLPIASLARPKLHDRLIPSRVKAIKWQNSSIYTITLEPDRELFSGFIAGQFLHLECLINGRRLLRTFSISSDPATFRKQGTIELSIREQHLGKVTPWLCRNLKPGDYVHISEAQGEFVLDDSNRPGLFIAAGSGITPILSMLLDKASERPDRSLSGDRLLYYVRSPAQTGFTEQFDTFRKQGLEIDIIETGRQGHICKAHLQAIDTDIRSLKAYVCGPGNMIQNCRTLLCDLGMKELDIHYEYFGPTTPSSESSAHSDRSTSITFSHSGITLNSEAGDSRTLLQIAESGGLKPLSGCRIGVCHQCVCKKTSGRVKNTKTGQISDAGAEEIQLCISQPVDEIKLEI